MSQATRSFFFGATLSEIGFILFFALLLFAFYRMAADSEIIEEEQHLVKEIQQKLASKEEELITKQKEFAVLERQFEVLEPLTQLSPEDQDRFFSELVPVVELQITNESLAKKNEGLQSQLAELSEVREQLKDLALENSTSEEKLSEALRVREAIEEAIEGKHEPPSPQRVAEAVKLAIAIDDFNQSAETPIKSYEQLAQQLNAADKLGEFQRENNNLKGQVANLRGRLGGRDLPPCWANKETGKIEYLFNIVILDEGLVLSRAAPEHRTSDYESLANTAQLTSRILDLNTFQDLAAPILEYTDSLGCRHYVSITDRSESAYKSTLTIEDYFYKFVNRI